MGLSLSLLFSAWEEILKHRFFSLAYNLNFYTGDGGVTVRRDSFRVKDSETMTKLDEFDASDSKDHKHEKANPETTDSWKELPRDIKKSDSNYSIAKNGLIHMAIPSLALPDAALLFSPRPQSELNAAAVRVQKVYKSYRTRRNLADCAVVVEEMWWKALDSAALELSSVSFFEVEKEQTAFSRWARATARVAKVGKGLSKDEKAQKLALQHWLEAIDPRHRYGHNLHLYYDIWSESSSFQPFFYWLDVGDGKEVNLAKCPRTVLQQQCIKYLGPKERETYEVIVEDGKLVYRQSGLPVETIEGSKWIFVLSTSRALYIGQKKKGTFQHSSFLAGAAITSAGRLVAHAGILEAIWPYSGHYLPTEENFQEFISFLEDNKVDLTNVKRRAVDDDSPEKSTEEQPKKEHKMVHSESVQSEIKDIITKETSVKANHPQEKPPKAADQTPVYSELSRRLSCKWSSGYGPRIGCVRDYPTELQNRALEQVNLSPRLTSGPLPNYGPIPSPRPSPKVRVSPRLSYMGLLSPRNSIQAAN